MRGLVASVALFAAVAAGGAQAAGQCPLTEPALLGGWKRVTDAGFFEVMAFEIEGGKRTFNSWLHQRPEFTDGSWALENCRLTIRHSTEERLTHTFAVRRASPNRLYLREVGEKKTIVYRRIRENR